jgi:hypothetical protein
VRDACSQKVSKNPKIVCAQVTLTKTGLSAVRTFRSLGVKTSHISLKWSSYYGMIIQIGLLQFGLRSRSSLSFIQLNYQ